MTTDATGQAPSRSSTPPPGALLRAWRPWLTLGRVSNLPTVWSNTLAALALGGQLPGVWWTAALVFVLQLFYVGGMLLNDAFDRQIDARERPGRPIPAGQVSASAVFFAGFGMLGLGSALVGALAAARHGEWVAAVGSSVVLVGCVVLYDWHHKGNSWSPVVMGLCRVMLYVTASVAARGDAGGAVLVGASMLFAYLVGLTYAAKQESLNQVGRWWPLACLAVPVSRGVVLSVAEPLTTLFVLALAAWIASALRLLLLPAKRNVPGAVGRLIAGIALLDALAVAGTGRWTLAVAVAALCPLTRWCQRYIAGT